MSKKSNKNFNEGLILMFEFVSVLSCPAALWRCIFSNDGSQLYYMLKSSLNVFTCCTLTTKVAKTFGVKIHF